MRGEVRGSWTLVGSNHQNALYRYHAQSLDMVSPVVGISSRTSTEKVAISIYFRGLLGFEASAKSVGSYGESKSVVAGGSSIEASGWSAQSCMACGNPNTDQRTRMIKI